jgi:hypothetical protein
MLAVRVRHESETQAHEAALALREKELARAKFVQLVTAAALLCRARTFEDRCARARFAAEHVRERDLESLARRRSCLRDRLSSARASFETATRKADDTTKTSEELLLARRESAMAHAHSALRVAEDVDRARIAALRSARDDDLRARQAAHSAEIDKAEARVTTSEKAVAYSAARVEADQTSARAAAIEKAGANVASARQRHDAASAELATTCDLVDTAAAAALREALRSCRSEEERLDEQISSLRARLASAEALVDARASLALAGIAARYRDLLAAEGRYADACEHAKTAERAFEAAGQAREAWACHASKAAELAAAESGIRVSQARVAALHDAFAGGGSTGRGVRGQLYEAHILPLFCGVANEFLDGIHAMRLGHFDGDLVVSNRGRGDDPYKSSGFQQFCMSLAVRCALHRLRLPGFSMSQIFIDEGFGACDRQNAQRIRDMLEALAAVGGYDSVWLCSNLDAVRDVADRVIDVVMRESGSSRIRIAH